MPNKTYTYLTPVAMTEKLPTAAELAKKVMDEYGLCSYNRKPNVNFCRAFMDNYLCEHGLPQMMTASSPRSYVYTNTEALFAYVDKLMIALKKYIAISVSIEVAGKNGHKSQNFRLYYRPKLHCYHGRPAKDMPQPVKYSIPANNSLMVAEGKEA